MGAVDNSKAFVSGSAFMGLISGFWCALLIVEGDESFRLFMMFAGGPMFGWMAGVILGASAMWVAEKLQPWFTGRRP